jgi:hypothetical protein
MRYAPCAIFVHNPKAYCGPSNLRETGRRTAAQRLEPPSQKGDRHAMASRMEAARPAVEDGQETFGAPDGCSTRLH